MPSTKHWFIRFSVPEIVVSGIPEFLEESFTISVYNIINNSRLSTDP